MNCEHCGTPLPEGAASCGVCGTPVAVIDYSNPAEMPAPEQVGLGILGALVGSLIGGASIVLLSRLGFVAAISGFLLAVCTLKGYELLGKKLSKTGIIVSIVLMVVVPFAADAIDWALVCYDELKVLGASVFDCLVALPEFLSEGLIPMSNYLTNLGLLYLFVVIGGFTTIRNALRKV